MFCKPLTVLPGERGYLIMASRNKIFWMLCLLAAVLVVLPGCPKKAETTIAPEAQGEETVTGQDNQGAGQTVEDQAGAAEAEEAAGLQPIHFDFDSAVIREDARDIMKANADWLKAHPQTRIRIEGSCDERGTREYNQALGQRRAAGAKRYLMDLGISAGRISLISYGKEKPVCTGMTEECWQQNRRDDFVAE